jgi:hypothetical protein
MEERQMTLVGRFSSMRAAVLLFAIAPLAGGSATAQQVFPSNVVVQGSLCVGLDCPSNPSFGFDTIILRENNLRIFFDDTSTAAGFPATKWRITINDSASGGAGFFRIDDVTGARQPFQITAGAPTNSLLIASNGNVGLGTATPVLDFHIRDNDTPSVRLEQDNSGGFSAQTWDIAGNEANFFIRDVTGGSRLPFRIRPGAPTSSIDISATGNVGLGLATAQRILHIDAGAGNTLMQYTNNTTARTATDGTILGLIGANGDFFLRNQENNALRFFTNDTERLTILAGGNVGIGTTVPATQFHTTGTVRFAGVANCSAGIQSDASGNLSCLVSSRQFKTVTGGLDPAKALANVMALRPQIGAYQATPDQPEHWLIAEDVAAVDPALAGHRDGKPYTVKTQNVVADLVAVIQQQQQRIEALERAVSR